VDAPQGENRTPPKYSNRTVALIDCLGFRNLIHGSVSDSQLLERIYSMQKIIFMPGRVGNPDSVDLKICHFSDSIIVSANDSIAGIWTVLLACRSFYHTVLGHGIFMRGGISVGLLLHEGNVVFGPALVEVDEIDKVIAGHPRIILSQLILDDIARKEEFWSKNYYDLYVKQDHDEKYFLDIFDHPKLEVNTKLLLDRPEGRLHTVAYFRRLVSQVDTYTADYSNARVRDKYVWFAHKLNDYLRGLRATLANEQIPLARE